MKKFLLFLASWFLFAGCSKLPEDVVSYHDKEYRIPVSAEQAEKVPPKIVTITKRTLPKEKVVHKTMYLTFDDGPLGGSENIISVLSQEHIPATMFMIGKHARLNAYHKKIYQAAINAPLILVANHTYSHANDHYRAFYADTKKVLKDLQKMDDILFDDDPYHGYKYCRLAGRNVFRLTHIHADDAIISKMQDESPSYDLLYQNGFYIYGWDYQWAYDSRNGRVWLTPEKLVENIEKIYQKGKTKKAEKFILLMHDFSFRDRFHGREKLQKLIQLLQKKKWHFDSLESYDTNTPM